MSDVNLPVVAEIEVTVVPQEAFAGYTRRMGAWWPLKTHSILEGGADELVVEEAVGGEIYERAGDARHRWATITAWEPPTRLAYSWQVNPANPPTHVLVEFTETDAGTRVRVTHGGWAALGERADQTRANYADGWPGVLGAFARLFEP